MRIASMTFTVEYKVFDVGERVTPTSPRSPLNMGEVYTVTKFVHPRHEGSDAIVFVEGRTTGLSSEYLTAEKDACEICKGDKGGVPGNENIIGGIVMCDYCHCEKLKREGKIEALTKTS